MLMNSKVPVVRKIAWISFLPQFLLLCLLCLAWYQRDKKFFVLFALFTYLMLFYIIRTLLARDHKNGIRNIRAGKFRNAVSDFDRSYQFFEKYRWIDNYRYLTLLSSSRMSYREMALINMAYCFRKLGQNTRAREIYEKTLREFPGSRMAMAGLRSLKVKKSI